MLKLVHSSTLIVLAIITASSCTKPAVTVHYEGNAQVELISSKGQRVLIDVYDPDKLSSPATESDILLTTHDHRDHFLSMYSAVFKGKKLEMAEGEMKIDEIKIQGVYSTSLLLYMHGPNKKLIGTTAEIDNYFFIIDFDGLRIIHFGDINQEKYTAEQLSKIGKVDLAIMQFDVPWHQINMQNKNGFKLMKEIRPSLIIPTHFSIEAAEYAMTLWPCLYTEKKTIKIYKKSRTSKDTRLLFMTSLQQGYAEIAKAVEWKE